MTIYDWPIVALGVRGISINPRGQVVGGPVSLSGTSQVLSIDAGYWIATLDVATLAKGAQIKLWRSLRALLKGGANQIRIPAVDEGQAPWPGVQQSATLSNWSDGARFGDGAQWSQGTIAVTVTSDAPLRSTSLAITVLSAGAIVGGEYFSAGDRLHVIGAVLSNDGAGHLVVAVDPPLREAATAGQALNFDAPVCRMRLISESEMDLPLSRLWQSAPTVNFVEVA